MTGHTANTLPFRAEATANPAGIRHTMTAIAKPTSSPPSAACQAGRRSTPNKIKTTAIGSSATRNDSSKAVRNGS